MMNMNKLILGLGSNLGDREKNLNSAIAEIEKEIGKMVAVSSYYETEPWGFVTENQFLNMAMIAETDLSPSGVIGRILMIEAKLGRSRSGKEYSSRVIDIDILFFSDLILDEPSLKIPHPLLHERRFVLAPLCEIVPDFIHPVFKISLSRLLSGCSDSSTVRKV
jgi:2-amino-4-hydroxy-6-hydroxymethyldihydropteridine diphosphokinase